MRKLLETDDVIIYTCDGDDLSDEEAARAFCLSEETLSPSPQFIFVKSEGKIYYEGSK